MPENIVHNAEQMKALICGGFFGSIVKLTLHPEKRWSIWLSQFIVGILCAVFIGGLLAHWLGAGHYGFSAVGFIIGTAAEQFLAITQRKLAKHLKEEKEEMIDELETPKPEIE